MNIEQRTALFHGAVEKFGFDAAVDDVFDGCIALMKSLQGYRRRPDSETMRAVAEAIAVAEIAVAEICAGFPGDHLSGARFESWIDNEKGSQLELLWQRVFSGTKPRPLPCRVCGGSGMIGDKIAANCVACGGSGSSPDAPIGLPHKCVVCKGTGMSFAGGGMVGEKCATCGGTGRVIDAEKCEKCKGRGSVEIGPDQYVNCDECRMCPDCGATGRPLESPAGGVNPESCPVCSGTGKRDGATCGQCLGRGKLYDFPCPHCSGSGDSPAVPVPPLVEGVRCSDCKGTGNDDCERCQGVGVVCSACHGDGWVEMTVHPSGDMVTVYCPQCQGGTKGVGE